MIGCKYAVEEALKTATALNKRGPFIHYNASIVFSTMGVVSWSNPKSGVKDELEFSWNMASHWFLLEKERTKDTNKSD